LSKTATAAQRQLLLHHWGRGLLVVMLDGDARDDAARLCRELGPGFALGAYAVPLPPGTDPGATSYTEIWQRIAAAVGSAGSLSPATR
jgi:hypothetical protein